MGSRLQEKLRERRERLELERITGQLAEVYTGRGLTDREAPVWVAESRRGFWDGSVPPAATFSCEAAPAELDAWIAQLLADHGMAGRIYVASTVGSLPWLECDTTRPGWLPQVRTALPDTWIFLSGSRDVLVEVSEQEYHYECFAAR